jgi:hypothetical protein
MDVDRAGPHDSRVAPDLGQQLLARVDATRMLHEVRKKVELRGCERHLSAGHRDSPGDEVDRHVAE